MTQRQSDVIFVAARAATTIRREAGWNSEDPRNWTREAVEIVVQNAASAPGAIAREYPRSRFIGDVCRDLEAHFNVRRGTWSRR